MLESIPQIYLAAIVIAIGFVGLIWSADQFVTASAAIAKSFGVAPAVIGLTIVSFGTSAPEVIVSINASLEGAGDLAVGNAIGSNIANISLVLAVTALISQIPFEKPILKYEMPVLLFISIVTGVFLYDRSITFVEGCLLLLALIPTIYYLAKHKQQAHLVDGNDLEHIANMSRRRAFIYFIVGLTILIFSARGLVWGAEITALHFGVSPLVIGLTVIAIGTSLPELAASVTSAVKGHHDIALGNIVGSNIFNILAVMSIPGILSQTNMETEVFSRDYMMMILVTLLLFVALALALWRSNNHRQASLGKGVGLILLSCYFAYYIYLFKTA